MKSTAPFQFQQFTIHQDLAAMKVGFDGILLGAWTDVSAAARILDVGTGTGVIALMLAQRTNGQSQVDAIDIDRQAVRQAQGNARNSPWAGGVRVTQASLQSFARDSCSKYDLIVCNPPFHSGPSREMTEARRQARHTRSLNVQRLLIQAVQILAPAGRIGVILPVQQREVCLAAAARARLVVRRELTVRPLPTKPAHRVVFEFGHFASAGTRCSTLTIERSHHHYTPEFQALTRDFYLRPTQEPSDDVSSG